MRDDGGSVHDPKSPEDVPWELVDPISPNTEAVINSISGLSAHGGGDLPEAYGRALWETATNPTVGWRPEAARLVLLIADNVPHDADLDEGIPESVWVQAPPWDTGDELVEPAGVVGTQLDASTNLDWQSVLAQLAADDIKLEVIAYHGESGYLPYMGKTGPPDRRTATRRIPRLSDEVTGLVEAGAPRPCASVPGSIGKKLLASLRCSAALLPLWSLRREALDRQGTENPGGDRSDDRRAPAEEERSRRRPPHRGPCCPVPSHHAPHGFTSSDEVVGKLEHPQTKHRVDPAAATDLKGGAAPQLRADRGLDRRPAPRQALRQRAARRGRIALAGASEAWS